MCTALHYTTHDHYFGRTLDIDCSFGEEVCILPRRAPLVFRQMGTQKEHYAMIGMATVAGDTPLFYDAANEHGLAMAGLNFPGNAAYHPVAEGKDNVGSFELVTWVLSQCKDLAEARVLLSRLNVADFAFSPTMPPAPLHWMIADRTGALVVESMGDGLHIHENPTGVMTNNPPFPGQLFNLNNYRHLSPDTKETTFAPGLSLPVYCVGLGGLGLPGDLSSMSRFVRAAFFVGNAVAAEGEGGSVSQFFHLLSSVEMPRGSCRTAGGTWDITLYSSCINTTRGLYYYTTYENRNIRCVDLYRADLSAKTLFRYPLVKETEIIYQN